MLSKTILKSYIKQTIAFALYKKFRAWYKKIKSSILYSTLAFTTSYYYYSLFNLVQNTFIYHHKKNISYKINFENIKSVIIVYSKIHFDPLNDYHERPLYYSGTANVTRQLWKLCEGKERFYIDIYAKKLDAIPKADGIIGLMSENFRLCAKENPQAKKVLILVNCHPLYRAKVLLEESKRLHKRLPPTEWVSPKLFFRVRKYADIIALTGNKVIKNTYLDLGVNEIPITTLNTGIHTERLLPNPDLRPKDKVRFIYPASHKALRKGLFRMLKAWKRLNVLVPKERMELYLVGRDESSFVKEVNSFTTEYTNAYNFDWVDSDTLLTYFQSSHVVVAPALEEGQVIAVLEAMACGAVPIITPQCGIDLLEGVEGFVVKDHKDAHEIASYMKKLIDDEILRENMSRAARSHVMQHNSWENFRRNFVRIFES